MSIRDYQELVDQISHAAKKMYDLRYEMSNGGNLSLRIPGKDWMLVKATDVAFDEIAVSSLVITDFDGNLIEGDKKASKESLLHGALYKAFPSVGAIMHCHSPYATAWAVGHDSLKFATHHALQKLGACPVFDTHSYVVSKDYFPEIVHSFQSMPTMKAFLLRGHGQVTVGSNIRDATYLAELVEETAQISILANIANDGCFSPQYS